MKSEIADNLSGFKYTLSQLCLPILFTQVVKDLEKEGKIKRSGNLNYKSVGIHDAEKYTIEIMK